MITEKMKAQLAVLNTRFKYVEDANQYGTPEYWNVMPLEKVMEGDCEDYSLTLLNLLEDNSKWKMFLALLNGKARLYYVKVPQNDGSLAGHCVLRYNGYYVDNVFRQFVEKSEMVTRCRYVFGHHYWLPVIGLKFIGSWAGRFIGCFTK